MSLFSSRLIKKCKQNYATACIIMICNFYCPRGASITTRIKTDPTMLNAEQQAQRIEILKQIRLGQNSQLVDAFRNNIQKGYEVGKYRPGIKYDGFIGRGHTLGFGFNPKTGEIKDYQWSFGSNPETYVITHPSQAKLVYGNNGNFDTDINAYSRKRGGKLNVNNLQK